MSRSDSYIDDSGESVRRKSTAGGRPIDNSRTRDRRVLAQQMLDAAEEVERRFPAGCTVQLPGMRLRILGVRESGRDATVKLVRYNVVGRNNLSGSPRAYSARATTFLKLAGDARPETDHGPSAQGCQGT